MNQRKMRIGMSIRGHGYHQAAWRHPAVPTDGTLHIEHHVRSRSHLVGRNLAAQATTENTVEPISVSQ